MPLKAVAVFFVLSVSGVQAIAQVEVGNGFAPTADRINLRADRQLVGNRYASPYQSMGLERSVNESYLSALRTSDFEQRYCLSVPISDQHWSGAAASVNWDDGKACSDQHNRQQSHSVLRRPRNRFSPFSDVINKFVWRSEHN